VRDRQPAADEVPDRLLRFDPSDWPPTAAEFSDAADGTTPAQAYAWRLRFQRRHWRCARIQWLAERCQPMLPEFLGRQSAEAAEFATDVAAYQREHRDEAQ
jgi:hypothetical protein